MLQRARLDVDTGLDPDRATPSAAAIPAQSFASRAPGPILSRFAIVHQHPKDP
jgi:hypothetical protein